MSAVFALLPGTVLADVGKSSHPRITNAGNLSSPGTASRLGLSIDSLTRDADSSEHDDSAEIEAVGQGDALQSEVVRDRVDTVKADVELSATSSQTGWVKSGAYWYHYSSPGVLTRGWLQTSDHWYYFYTDTGVMATGWLSVGSHWYFLNPAPDRGEMLTG